MMITRIALRNNTHRAATRFYSGNSPDQGTTGGASAVSRPPPSAQINADVPGLSSACVHPATQPVGPGVDPNKSGAYKVPEYFCYNITTFYEAEVEMSKFRCPQPSALKK